MVVVSLTQQPDGSLDANRWEKVKGKRAKKTHMASAKDPTWAEIEQYRMNPPETLRVT